MFLCVQHISTHPDILFAGNRSVQQDAPALTEYRDLSLA